MAGAAGVLNTLIRGHVYDFSSVHISIAGKTVFCSFQEINYNWSRDIGILRGNGSAMKKGRTRGEFNFEGSMTIAKSDTHELHSALAAMALGGGFGEAVFDIIVTYAEKGEPVPITDTLIGCTLTSSDNSHSRSPDPLVVNYDFDIMDIKLGGLSPASPDALMGAVGMVGGILGRI